ncbi:hypothetical protein [Ramlibacter sp.]|uniref:hypothetical protein n=1 Tax=Ramlibacter sp. TaxID=1917967 RepID=UPI002639B83A|nr:hypothetical protein [Ramlibacter sp.]MDB5958433.1 hypothetical protein [Ramlibacter sp.]
MPAPVPVGVVRHLIHRLPGRLLAALDAWSHRLARKRHQERMRKWQARQIAAVTPSQLPPTRGA